MSDEISPFELVVPESVLDDLRTRLRSTRWPEAETAEGWSQGIPLAYLREVCDYWAEQYDWRLVESRLNELGQFRTSLDGLGIHFLHVRSPEPDALPLLLTHGWPGSVVEFLNVIGPLTDPGPTAGRRAMHFTWSARRSPAMASATSRRCRAGRSSVSPGPGAS